jgi:predicted phosphodiesterase
MTVNFKANEQVVKAGDSTYHKENEKVQGKLIITNQRVYFISENGDAGKYDLEILPAEIRELIYFSTNMFSPNGFDVIMKNGEILKFTMKKRDELAALINKMY